MKYIYTIITIIFIGYTAQSKEIYLQSLNKKSVDIDFLKSNPEKILSIEIEDGDIFLNCLKEYSNKLINVEYIYIINTRVNLDSISFYKMKSLKGLEIKYSNLTKINLNILNCTKLERLIIEGTEISIFPIEKGNFKNLKILMLNYNKKLVSITGSPLVSVERFTIQNAPNLVSISHHLFSTGVVKYIYISENSLSKMPNSLKKCKNINEIFIKINEKLKPRKMTHLFSKTGVNKVIVLNSRLLDDIRREKMKKLLTKKKIEVAFN